MGNQQSRLYQKLWNAYPSHDSHGCSGSGWFDKTSKPFANREDKDQFIYATLTVLSQNGSIDLDSHEVRLLYSRRDNDRMVARIVAEKEGVVKAQIAPRDDGKDQVEAFKALRKHVEMMLDQILQDVPGAVPNGKAELAFGTGSSRSPANSPIAPPLPPARQSSGRLVSGAEHQEPQGRVALPMDAPPAYGKAVREWRSSNDEKK